ncbi:MAG: RIP metalloprotease RseP [Planctomyces sp.]|nr:RIP metalloprotease RseP [Planctomyces sp.]
MEAVVLAAIPSADRLLSIVQNIATVAIGLGLVIFFHELGHFAVAKWCGVFVERFSIGFGPILWRRKWGDTEYALSAIPFGGYVKMLGQDDIDPGQMADEQVAADPRSYTSKTVPQRMAIISAGVTMNVITGLLFFMLAFRAGIKSPEPEVGLVRAAMPAWQHGIRDGDVITSMNDRSIEEFTDILRQTALSRGDIRVVGLHEDGTPFDVTFAPDGSGIRRMIGIGPQHSLQAPPVRDTKKYPIVQPGSPAATVDFQPGDRIIAAQGQSIQHFRELERLLAQYRDEPITLDVERKGTSGAKEQVQLTLAPQPFRGLGLRMSMGRIAAVRNDSPAARAGIQKNDLITHVDSQDVGRDIDPLRLPDYFSERAGQEVVIRVKQEQTGNEPRTQEFTVIPDDRLPWSEPPFEEKAPLSIPSLGVAFDVLPNILSVREDGAAANLGLQPGDSVVGVTIPQDPALKGSKSTTINVGTAGWAYAFHRLQLQPSVTQVSLEVKKSGKDNQTFNVDVELQPIEGWNQTTTRGLLLAGMTEDRKADNLGDALAMSWTHTRNSVVDIYLTLRNLIFGDLSIKSLHGPIGIAKAASVFAEEGLADFLLFLGLISINLAVINFLPIPVLDGGHMVFLIWEAIARRKPSERVIVTATYVGFALVVGLMITVIYVDLFEVKK